MNEIYRDERYVLGKENNLPYVKANGKKYNLTCHPYEPCLYITDESGQTAFVHNSFDPAVVIDIFSRGDMVNSITGFEYDAKDFCQMVEYASKMGDIQIDDAENIFGGRAKKKTNVSAKKSNCKEDGNKGTFICPESVSIIEEDPFYNVVKCYPDSVIDYCLLKHDEPYKGIDSHFEVLLCAALNIITEDFDLKFDVGNINAKMISSDELFASVSKNGEKLNYRRAFRFPPYPNGYTDEDFEKLNDALFPSGRDGLEIFEWSTGWSDYFADGYEWWGTLCISVYDTILNRFVVIMASATD